MNEFHKIYGQYFEDVYKYVFALCRNEAIAEDAYSIHKVLHSLPEPYKEVFTLRTFGELSFSSIGNLFEKTDTWARVTYYRARIKIQEELE